MPKIHDVDNDFSEVKKDKTTTIRLDLACGNNKRKGFTGVDIVNTYDTDMVHNLNLYPYPFEKSSVSEINCSHFIEHVTNIKLFMEECYRILVPNGVMEIVAPYYSSARATQDFTHLRSISENTFLYFQKSWIKENSLEHYNINCDFKVDNMQFIYAGEWKTRAKEAQEFARKHYINVVNDIAICLRAIKK